MGREPSWSGQLPLLPHLFESLLALSGSSCKHTLTLYTLMHTGCFRFRYLLLLLGSFHGLERGQLQREYVCVLSNLVLCSLTVVGTSCLSSDHNLPSDWPVWCERGGEKSHFSLAELFFFCANFLFPFCEVSIFVTEQALLCCWVFII